MSSTPTRCRTSHLCCASRHCHLYTLWRRSRRFHSCRCAATATCTARRLRAGRSARRPTWPRWCTSIAQTLSAGNINHFNMLLAHLHAGSAQHALSHAAALYAQHQRLPLRTARHAARQHQGQGQGQSQSQSQYGSVHRAAERDEDGKEGDVLDATKTPWFNEEIASIVKLHHKTISKYHRSKTKKA